MSNNKQLDSTVDAVDKVKLLSAAESVRDSLEAHKDNYDNSKLIRDALNYSQMAFENIEYICKNWDRAIMQENIVALDALYREDFPRLLASISKLHARRRSAHNDKIEAVMRFAYEVSREITKEITLFRNTEIEARFDVLKHTYEL